MISLTSDMTDCKGRHARGWLFFDGDCEFCTRIARRLAGPMRRRALALAPLQDPRVAALLGLSPEQLLRSIRLVLSDGRHHVGADAILAVLRELGWARCFGCISHIPGAMPLLRDAYDRIARRRHCRAQRRTMEIPHPVDSPEEP